MSGEPPKRLLAGRFLPAAELEGRSPPPLRPLAALDVVTGLGAEVYPVPRDPAADRAPAAAAGKLAGLRHPALQGLTGVFSDPADAGLSYWVYAAPPGRSFEDLAAEGRPFSEAEAANMAVSLAGALKKLHEAFPRLGPRRDRAGRAISGGGRPGRAGRAPPFPRRPARYRALRPSRRKPLPRCRHLFARGFARVPADGQGPGRVPRRRRVRRYRPRPPFFAPVLRRP